MTGQHSAQALGQHAQRAAEGLSDAGLVTSINNAETRFLPPFGGSEVIKLDKVKGRCTRLRKNLGVASKWLSQSGGQAWMLTFTYARVEDWKPSHVRDALAHLRKWLLRAHGARLRYVWVMETAVRKSGDQIGQSAPHYHVVVWLPVQVTSSSLKFDALGWWPHGSTNQVKAVAAVRYVMKYASKFDNEGTFPKGARIYGIGGMDAVGAGCRRWINWPSFVQANSSSSDRSRRVPCGGWLIARTGELLPSEWGVCYLTRSSAVLVRLHTHAREIEDPRGPFSWLKK